MSNRILAAVLAAATVVGAAACGGSPADAAEQVVFAWTPGEATAKTSAGAVPFRLADGAKLVACPAGAAATPGPDGRIAAGAAKLGQIPEAGTITLWARFSRVVRLDAKGKPPLPLFSCEDLTISLVEAKDAANIAVEAGELLRNAKFRGKFGSSFTHFRANQWYRISITYNAPVKNAWRAFLYGVEQPEPWWEWPFKFRNDTTRVELRGRAAAEPTTEADDAGAKDESKKVEPLNVELGPVRWTAGQRSGKQLLAELKAVKGFSIPPNRGEGLQVFAEPFDAEALGGEVLVAERFDAPLKPGRWIMEGPGKLAVEDGRLVVTNRDHCTFWLKEKLPRDLVAAWDIQPSHLEGLTIVFISADGIDGRDLFDPTLARRTGQFNQYVHGDIRSYHFSYYAGTRGSANGRKNPGLQMVAICQDVIGRDLKAGRKGPWRVAIVRRGPRIDLAVNQERILTFIDDPAIRGPVHGGGYFGLRQMKRSEKVSYDNLVIRRLKPPAPSKD